MTHITSGFYKIDSDGYTLHHAPQFVINAAYELYRETKDQHTYPVDGWSWYANEEEARAALTG